MGRLFRIEESKYDRPRRLSGFLAACDFQQNRHCCRVIVSTWGAFDCVVVGTQKKRREGSINSGQHCEQITEILVAVPVLGLESLG